MIHPCPIKSNCLPGNQFLGADTPFANLSSEAPDVDLFLGSNFGWDLNVPRLGWTFTDTDGPAWCRGTTQQAADGCAAVQQLGGGGGNTGQVVTWRNPTGQPIPLFFNQQISCPATCPDGTQFVWTIAAGKYQAMNQAQANAIAQSFACQLAFSNKICLSNIPNACLNQPYVFEIIASGGTPPFTFQIVNGSLPPGLSLFTINNTACQIIGTPTSAGSFIFTLTAVDANGNFMTKAYGLPVLGISNSNTLAPFSSGAFYSAQLTGVGGVSPYTFSLASGALPIGLSLSANGTISGTPTSNSNASFSVSVTDSNGASCSIPVTMTAAGCSTVFANPSWNITFSLPPGPPFGNASGSASGPSFAVSSSSDGIVLPVQANADFGVNGPELPYTLGKALTCKLTVNTSASGTANAAAVLNARLQDNSVINLITSSPVPLGTTVFTFTIPSNCKTLIFQGAVAGGNGAGGAGSINMNGTFGN